MLVTFSFFPGLHAKHATASAASQPLPAPNTEPGVAPVGPPTQISAAPNMAVVAPVEMKTNGGNHFSAVQSRTALVDLTSPTEELGSAAPLTVDLTAEVGLELACLLKLQDSAASVWH